MMKIITNHTFSTSVYPLVQILTHLMLFLAFTGCHTQESLKIEYLNGAKVFVVPIEGTSQTPLKNVLYRLTLPLSKANFHSGARSPLTTKNMWIGSEFLARTPLHENYRIGGGTGDSALGYSENWRSKVVIRIVDRDKAILKIESIGP
jgi:hypothetical protein